MLAIPHLSQVTLMAEFRLPRSTNEIKGWDLLWSLLTQLAHLVLSLQRSTRWKKLEDGDIVNIDVSIYYKGVHGDLNETYFVGNVDEASQQLVKCTYECMEKAIAIVKPGVRFREIGEIINRHATMSGLSVVKSYCGHGIGELFHCAPNIPHYAIGNKAVGVMKAGQTFTIEPMINAGVWRDRMWPDGWTDVTADGKRSAQFEHTLLVTETGVEVLTARLPTSPKVFPWLD
ncbi:methionine aminopeptidase 1A [Tanacetum coccineum]